MSWEDEVRALYLREPDMETDEFERLLTIAQRGERPDDSRLPAYLPLALDGSAE